MENAIALAHVMGPAYALVGLSLLLHFKAWQKLLERWTDNHLELFTLMFGYIVLGAVSVNMYNVWEWNIWLVVTVTGWAMLLKGAAYFLLPGDVLKNAMAMHKNTNLLYFGGFVALVFGLLLTYYSYLV